MSYTTHAEHVAALEKRITKLVADNDAIGTLANDWASRCGAEKARAEAAEKRAKWRLDKIEQQGLAIDALRAGVQREAERLREYCACIVPATYEGDCCDDDCAARWETLVALRALLATAPGEAPGGAATVACEGCGVQFERPCWLCPACQEGPQVTEAWAKLNDIAVRLAAQADAPSAVAGRIHPGPTLKTPEG